MTNRRYDLTWLIAALVFGLFIGLTLGASVKSYPTEPSAWSCETTYQLRDGYKLCRVKEGV